MYLLQYIFALCFIFLYLDPRLQHAPQAWRWRWKQQIRTVGGQEVQHENEESVRGQSRRGGARHRPRVHREEVQHENEEEDERRRGRTDTPYESELNEIVYIIINVMPIMKEKKKRYLGFICPASKKMFSVTFSGHSQRSQHPGWAPDASLHHWQHQEGVYAAILRENQDGSPRRSS